MRRFLAIVAAALSIAACSQTGGVEPAERQARADGLVRMTTELPQQQAEYHHFDFFGRIHNEGLEHVFQSQLVTLPNREYSEAQLVANVASATTYYVDEVCSITRGTGVKDFPVNDYLAKRVSLQQALDAAADVSTFQKQVLLRIDTILLTANGNLESVNTDLASVQSQIDHHMNTDDKAFLYAALSVARHSVRYWSDDKVANKWMDVVNEFGGKYRRGFHKTLAIDWGKVAEADYNGFCAAVIHYAGSGAWKGPALRGAIIGSCTTGGVGAVAAAIINVVGHGAAAGVAGAVGMSALEVLRQELF